MNKLIKLKREKTIPVVWQERVEHANQVLFIKQRVYVHVMSKMIVMFFLDVPFSSKIDGQQRQSPNVVM